MTPENEKILGTPEMQAWLKEMKARSQAALQRIKDLAKELPPIPVLEEDSDENI